MWQTTKSPLSALLLLLLAFAVAAAPASASPGHGHPGGERNRVSGPRTSLGESRAVSRKRCVERRARRVAGTRRRCTAQKSSAIATRPLYWGATIGSQLTGNQAPWDMGAVSSFEAVTHKSPSLVQFFQPFAECGSSCTFLGFPKTPMDAIRQHGSIPVLSWSSQSIPSSLDEPDYQLSDVIEGRYDEGIRRFATEAREWGQPFFLRFNWEMNGNWFPWSESVNGNQPGQYVAAWRHVHDIFASVGASNVSWVWCPFVDPSGSLQGLSSLYPGDEYVDWTGLDGYNWGTNPAAPRGWKTFDQLFSRSYDYITQSIAPSRPMMIAEMGSSEQGGSKSEWISNALSEVPTEYPDVRAMLWFDKFDDGMDWPLETSAAAGTAFAEGIQDPAYVGASFAGLGGAAIQPPS